MLDHMGRGAEGERSGDHLIAWADSLGYQGQMERRRPGGQRHRSARPDVSGELGLEFPAQRAVGQPAGL